MIKQLIDYSVGLFLPYNARLDVFPALLDNRSSPDTYHIHEFCHQDEF